MAVREESTGWAFCKHYINRGKLCYRDRESNWKCSDTEQKQRKLEWQLWLLASLVIHEGESEESTFASYMVL